MLTAAGHVVATEQRDPSMSPNARLDIVEFASDVGAPTSVVTPLREDAGFREAERRHSDKLDQQYGRRRLGSLARGTRPSRDS